MISLVRRESHVGRFKANVGLVSFRRGSLNSLVSQKVSHSFNATSVFLLPSLAPARNQTAANGLISAQASLSPSIGLCSAILTLFIHFLYLFLFLFPPQLVWLLSNDFLSASARNWCKLKAGRRWKRNSQSILSSTFILEATNESFLFQLARKKQWKREKVKVS